MTLKEQLASALTYLNYIRRRQKPAENKPFKCWYTPSELGNQEYILRPATYPPMVCTNTSSPNTKSRTLYINLKPSALDSDNFVERENFDLD